MIVVIWQVVDKKYSKIKEKEKVSLLYEYVCVPIWVCLQMRFPIYFHGGLDAEAAFVA